MLFDLANNVTNQLNTINNNGWRIDMTTHTFYILMSFFESVITASYK